MAVQTRYYSSTAAKTTLSVAITNSATSFSVAALTGYPVSLPWLAIINRDQADEEVILVTAVSGTTITNCTRGYDSTTAVAHSSTATFEHGVSAIFFNDMEAHKSASQQVHGLAAASSVVGTTDTQTLTNKTLNGATLDAASTLGGISGTTLSGAWSTYTPTFANLTLGNGTTSGRYKQVGKKVTFTAYVTLGSTSSFPGGNVSISIPVASVASGQNQYVLARYFNNVAASSALGYGEIQNNSGTCSLWAPTSNTATKIDGFAGTVIGSAMTATGSFVVAGTYEAA